LENFLKNSDDFDLLALLLPLVEVDVVDTFLFTSSVGEGIGVILLPLELVLPAAEARGN